MAFMKTILDNGTPTGQSDANSSEDETNHARLSLSKDDEDAEKEKRDNEDEDKDEDNTKSHQSSDEEPDYSSFSESEEEGHKGKTNKHRRRLDSQSSAHSSEDKRRVKRKPPTGNRQQPWHSSDLQSHQDMLHEKFAELRNLLTDTSGNQVDKHLLKKTRVLMKHYQVAQAGLIPGPGIKGPKSPRTEKQSMYWGRSSSAWHEQDTQPEYTHSSSPVTATGDEYILIDGTGDEVKTRRVKFSNVETESIPDGHPSLDVLGSLGLPFPVAPSAPRPTSGWNRKSRPRRKAASAERPRDNKERKPKRKSVTRSPSAEPRSRSRSSSSRSRSRSRSQSTKRDDDESEKLKKTDHRLKDTDNHVLQEWLKKKDQELKAKKKEERKHRKEKREKKRREYAEKQKIKEKSEEAVKIWFVKKEEEQRLLQRRERERRPLQKNEFSYSLELITLTKSPEGDVEDHHASNPEMNSREASGAPFASSAKTKKRAPRLRGKSAKVRSANQDKSDAEEAKKDRESYDQWLGEKRESEKLEKEKAHEGEKSDIAEKENIVSEQNVTEEANKETNNENVDENNKDTEPNKPDMDDEELLTDFGQRRDVNMNIKRKDSDSFDPYDKPKDYTLDHETRRNLMQFSDSHEKEENDSPTKLESSQPSFRLPSPPLLSHSPVPVREKPTEGDPTVEPGAENPYADVTPHPPKPDVPRTSAYRRIKREQASWDEFSDNVWTQVNKETEEGSAENPTMDDSLEFEENEPNQEYPKGEETKLDEDEQNPDQKPFDQDHDNSGDQTADDFNEPMPEIKEQAYDETGLDKEEGPTGSQTSLAAEETIDNQETDGNEKGSEVPETKEDDDPAPIDADGDAEADDEPPPLMADALNNETPDIVNEDHNMHVNSQANPEESESAFVREEYDVPMSDALHLNPIKEESELEVENTSKDDSKLADDENEVSDDKQKGSNQADESDGKTVTTFLTTSDE